MNVLMLMNKFITKNRPKQRILESVFQETFNIERIHKSAHRGRKHEQRRRNTNNANKEKEKHKHKGEQNDIQTPIDITTSIKQSELLNTVYSTLSLKTQ